MTLVKLGNFNGNFFHYFLIFHEQIIENDQIQQMKMNEKNHITVHTN